MTLFSYTRHSYKHPLRSLYIGCIILVMGLYLGHIKQALETLSKSREEIPKIKVRESSSCKDFKAAGRMSIFSTPIPWSDNIISDSWSGVRNGSILPAAYVSTCIKCFKIQRHESHLIDRMYEGIYKWRFETWERE